MHITDQSPMSGRIGQAVLSKPSESITFSESLQGFMASVETISAQFKMPRTSVIKRIIENTCEYKARYEVNFPRYWSDQTFDSYFKIKHEFEKNKFVQKLAFTLKEHGLQACVSTEEKTMVGVFDVVITNTKYLITVTDKQGKKIVVEWKSSASFSISQIERYLWAATTVILVRSKFSQVISINRSDVEQYLTRSLAALRDRCAAITSSSMDDLQKIPGPYCKECPVARCEFYKAPSSNGKKIIAFNSETMRNDMLSMFSGVDQCIEQAIDAVMKELTS